MELLNICLTSTFFPFENKFYQGKDPMKVGNSSSPVVTGILLFMEHFKKIELETEEHNPAKWSRSIEHTSVVSPYDPEKLQQLLCLFNILRPTVIFAVDTLGRFCHE
jgi:hypothetical protein